MLATFQNILDRSQIFKFTLQVCVGVVLLWAMSQISIPLKPVPITLQTVGVMAIGLFYRRNQALSTIGVYLILGAAGLPIFSNYSGSIAAFWGSTGGYLVGFFAAVWVMTSVQLFFDSDKYLSIAINCIIGTAVIFVFGISWLSFLIGFKQAIVLGFLPFIMPGLVKALLLSFVTWYVKRA